MKVKTILTNLKDLYGLNYYAEHLRVGDELWTDEGKFEEITNKKWNKIKITYLRSGVMFFELVGFDIPEQAVFISSFNVSVMKVAKLDPYKEFPDKKWLNNYRFDDTFTEVVNFDNSVDKEINEEEFLPYLD